MIKYPVNAADECHPWKIGLTKTRHYSHASYSPDLPQSQNDHRREMSSISSGPQSSQDSATEDFHGFRAASRRGKHDGIRMFDVGIDDTVPFTVTKNTLKI